jgi:uncharacterized membrane protein YgcG
MIDRQRFATIFGTSMLVLSLVAFGVPVPTIVQDGTPETTGTTGAVDAPTEGVPATPASVELRRTDGVLTQDAEALACGGICTAGIIAVTAGAAGTVIGSTYFSESDEAIDDSGATQSAAYYTVQSFEDRIETNYKTLNSSYESTRTMAYRVGETSFAEAMANDSSKSEAQQAADQAVTEYLADTIEDEFVRRNNAYMSQVDALIAQNATSINAGYTGLSYRNWTIYSDTSEARTFNISTAYLGTSDQSWLPYQEITMSGSIEFSFEDAEFDTIHMETYGPETQDLVDDYLNIRGEVVSEITNFSDSVNESQYENLSPDDVVSPVNQALEWGQSYNETGSSGYAAALASSLGYAVNGTGTMYHVKMPASSSTWYNGTVYADEGTIPGGTIETGTVYNGSDTTAYVATKSGSTELNDDWKVVSIESRTGETLNQTKLSTWSRDELNASDPLETLNEWKRLNQNVSDDGGDGLFGGLLGGDGFLPFIPGGNLVHVLIVAGGAFLLSRRDGGGGTFLMGGGGSSGSGGSDTIVMGGGGSSGGGSDGGDG